MQNKSLTYKDSGVDTEKGQKFIQNIKNLVHRTHSSSVLTGLGGFAAAFDASFLKEYQKPVILSGTDGVGTKLELARLLDIHHTVGIDLVAMCVNDLLVMGGKPLFFQDYIACGKLNLEKMERIMEGIVEGCIQANVSLIGGETAEHPGVMAEDEYDLAGFVVGIVEKDEIIDGSKVREGDILLGLESSGPHSNGFSLIRKLFLRKGKLPSDSKKQEMLRELAMKPTLIYVPYILDLLKHCRSIHGMVHITGGGFYENIPRILGRKWKAVLYKSHFPRLEFFEYIYREFGLEDRTMYSTFNMGIGYILILSENDIEIVQSFLQKKGLNSFIIGKIFRGEGVEILD